MKFSYYFISHKTGINIRQYSLGRVLKKKTIKMKKLLRFTNKQESRALHVGYGQCYN